VFKALNYQTGYSTSHLKFQLLGRQRQEDPWLKVSQDKVRETLISKTKYKNKRASDMVRMLT
jgi:hypothetical protein